MTGKQCAGVFEKSPGPNGGGSVIFCTRGPNGQAATANFALVKIESSPLGTTMETTRLVTHCKACAVATKLTGGCIGFLPKRELGEYHAAINSPHPTQFIVSGITKVSMTDSTRDLIHMYTSNHLSRHNPKQSLLKHNTSNKRAPDGIPTKKTTDGRMWCQIYPLDTYAMAFTKRDVGRNSMLVTASDLIKEHVARTVLPDLYFSQQAVKAVQLSLDEDPLDHANWTSADGLLDHILSLTHINLLWKGLDIELNRPMGRQSIHMDGRRYKIVVLIPLQYHEPLMYDFYYIAKTHRIDSWKYDGNEVADDIQSELATGIIAKMNEMIVFSERLMHAGGTCSKTRDSKVSTPTFTDNVWKTNNGVGGDLYDSWFGTGETNERVGPQPTDVAAQFVYELNLLSSNTAVFGNGAGNIWTKNEIWQDGENQHSQSGLQTRLGKLPNNLDEAKDEFVTPMMKAKTEWLHCLSSNTEYKFGSGKRKRHKSEDC